MSDIISSKYTFICDPDECDTMIEVTTSDGFGFPSGVVKLTCPCGRDMLHISSESATIAPSSLQTESNQMENQYEPILTPTVPETYNPNSLITYKSIVNGEATYPSIKTVDLEYQLHENQLLTTRLNNLQTQVNSIIDNLNADGWYNPNYEKVEVLNDLCEILGHEPKQTVRITATIQVEVDYDIPLEEVEDFDARYFLSDNLSIDSWHGDVSVDSWSVEDHDVDWNVF
jgi:hypothetical protein